MELLGLREADKTMTALVGGKGANLGELFKIEGIHVPDGFCITTKVFRDIVSQTGRNKQRIELATIPVHVMEEIDRFLFLYGDNIPYAIRSSATAEDLPSASFAGQQDTYLNIVGRDSIIYHIRKCWASLFTGRAIAYRAQHGFDDSDLSLAVVIQKMVFSQVSGVMFTADPVTSNRKVLSIDAGFGLGEAIVSGKINTDVYKVRDGNIVDKKIPAKQLAIHAKKNGGVLEQEVDPVRAKDQALSDREITELYHIGRKIENHFGVPQDIEWCLVDGKFYIVQSRPITTLYPVPLVNDDRYHVYVSVGHQQMMTDAMKPLGLSVRDLTGRRSMHVAGGRMFVDVAPLLASPAGRESLIDVLGKSDPLIKDALTEIIRRGNFPESEPQEKSHASHDFRMLGEYDARTVAGLINESESELSELKKIIENLSGSALIDCILSDLEKLSKSISDPRVFGVIMTGMNAAFWLNDRMEEWLNEKNVADTLSLSVPDNITSEMGLALLDVSDVIRRHDRVVDYLQRTKDDNFLDRLGDIEGGVEVRHAIVDFLEKYGMRCAGEIDITRPRWSEKPLTLVPAILTNVRNLEPNEASRRFERGKQEYLRKENELLERLRHLPDGEEKAKETKRMIDLMRCLAGYREYPKYAMVCRYFVYKRALLKEAAVMSRQGIINEPEDIYYLTLGELKEGNIDRYLIALRKEEHRQFEKLAPPRVMTSDGEIITGRYNREGLPGGAIAGLAVSSGMIEGRARVILKIEDADLEEGDILVTTFTDPSWTPLFVSIKGLVTEVGGLMTHGAVIAREYGLPAVVGVENATRTIQDGDRIRVNGSEGYVEILERSAD